MGMWSAQFQRSEAGISDLTANSAPAIAGVRSVTAMSHEKKTNGSEEMFWHVSQETRDSSDSASVAAVITRMPQRGAQQENDTCMQFSPAACASLNLCPLPLSFNSSFLLLPLLTSHPPPPQPLFIFAATPSHLLCTMPPENLWNPLKFKCILPLKMTQSAVVDY